MNTLQDIPEVKYRVSTFIKFVKQFFINIYFYKSSWFQ